MGKKKKKRNKNKGQEYLLDHNGNLIMKGQNSKHKKKGAWKGKGHSSKDTQKSQSPVPKPLEWGKGYSLQTPAKTTESSNHSSQGAGSGCTQRVTAQARALDRYQSICTPGKKPKGNLQRKEHLLAVVENLEKFNTADTKEYFDELSNRTFKSKTAMNEYRFKHFGIPKPSSGHYSDSKAGSGDENYEKFKFSEVLANTNVANAALGRVQAVPKRKKRLGKTADMILAEARTEEELEVKNRRASPEPSIISKKKAHEWYVARGGASEAARDRMEGARKKKGRGVLTNESRAHELLYGDVLKQEEHQVFKASDGSEFQSATSRDRYEEELENQSKFLSPVEQISEHFILFVNWSESDIIAGTTKIMLKMIDKLLKAETDEEKQKFGRLRLNNKAIIKRFVKVPYALALLGAIGFVRAKSAGEDVLSFHYTDVNRKSLEFLKQCILECQAEMKE